MMHLQVRKENTDNKPVELSPPGNFWEKPLLPVLENKKAELSNNLHRKPFITIDDLARIAKELSDGIAVMSEYRHPLDIRRGSRLKEGLDIMFGERESSKVIKAGSKTYFFDVRKTKENIPYLSITESRLKGGKGDHERNTIIVFPEDANKFRDVLSEMIDTLPNF